jgi:hypothetical protein
MKRKVNLFLVGAAKSGTTTFYKILGQHPEVFVGDKKEPHYFARDLFTPSNKYSKKLTLTLEEYEQNYVKAQDEKYLLDASVYYMYFEECAQRIFDYNPNAKIIMICREPVSRFYSHYKMLRKEGVTTLPLLDFIKNPIDNNGLNLLKMGEYEHSIRRFEELFKDNFLVVDFKLLKTLDEFLAKITHFLDINPEFNHNQEHENQSGIPKNNFLSYLHMNFPITLFLKSIMPKSKFRSSIGKFVLKQFYTQPPLTAIEENEIRQYYEKHT